MDTNQTTERRKVPAAAFVNIERVTCPVRGWRWTEIVRPSNTDGKTDEPDRVEKPKA